MGASKEDEDEAYKRFAEACGQAWLGRASTFAVDALDKDARRIDDANPAQPLLAEIPAKSRSARAERFARR